MKVEKSVTIHKPAAELYRFWRNFENLPRFMKHVEGVSILDDKRSHWRVKGPAGSTVEWDAAIINERENELISWKSLEDAEVENAGSVIFRQSPRGNATEVKVVLNYDEPAGALGRTVAKVFGEEPSQQVEEDLRRFKEIMEAGQRQ